MFEKRIIEVFILIAYWLVITPLAYECAKQNNLLEWDLNKLSDSLYRHAVFALCIIVAYIVTYRICMFIYLRVKVCDIQMWHRVKKMKADPEACMNEREKKYKYVQAKTDVIDGPPTPKPCMIRTISDPLLIENELTRIHNQHHTLPLFGHTRPNNMRTLTPPPKRAAPPTPSPKRHAILPVPGRARGVANGIVIKPEVLMTDRIETKSEVSVSER